MLKDNNCEPQLVSQSATLMQIMDMIKQNTIKGINHDLVSCMASIAQMTTNPIKSVFDQVYNEFVYYPDAVGIQDTKSIKCICKRGNANCVDYSTVIGSVLLNLGIPFFYKVVGYSQDRSHFDHIYIVTQTNPKYIIDCVLGQKIDGSETFENRPKQGQFNKEAKYVTAKYFAITTGEFAKHTNSTRNSIIRRPMTQLRQLQGVRDDSNLGCPRTLNGKDTQLGIAPLIPIIAAALPSVLGFLGGLFGGGRDETPSGPTPEQLAYQQQQQQLQLQAQNAKGNRTMTYLLAGGGIIAATTIALVFAFKDSKRRK